MILKNRDYLHTYSFYSSKFSKLSDKQDLQLCMYNLHMASSFTCCTHTVQPVYVEVVLLKTSLGQVDWALHFQS